MKKMEHFAKVYTLGTEGIFSLVVFTAIGFLIGWKIDKDSFWPPLLAVIGMFIGLSSFIVCLLELIKQEEKRKKHEESK